MKETQCIRYIFYRKEYVWEILRKKRILNLDELVLLRMSGIYPCQETFDFLKTTNPNEYIFYSRLYYYSSPDYTTYTYTVGKLLKIPVGIYDTNVNDFYDYLKTNQQFYIVQDGVCFRTFDAKYLVDESIQSIESAEYAENLKQQEVVKQQDSDRKCNVCWEFKTLVAIVNCGHYAFCNDCLSKLKKCPLCQKSIDKIINIYIG